MANLPDQQDALNAFPNLPWSACLILAFEVDLTYCMQMVDGDRTNVYPALRTADSIFPYAQQTLLVGNYVSVYMC